MAKGGRVLGVSVESGVHYEAQLILFTSHCHLVPPSGKGIQLSVYLSSPQISRLNLANFNLASRHSIRNVTKLLTQEMPPPSARSKAVLNSALGLTLSSHIEGLITINDNQPNVNTLQVLPLDILVGARELERELQLVSCASHWQVGFFKFHF